MEKKQYIQPSTILFNFFPENIMQGSIRTSDERDPQAGKSFNDFSDSNDWDHFNNSNPWED